MNVGKRFEQLHGNRADPARAAHQQQGAAAACHGFVYVEAVKQGFPRGKRGQRQRGGLGKIERARFAGNDALVHRLHLGIRAGAVNHAGVIDFVADLKMLYAAADGFDHARRVPAQNAVLPLGGRMRGADFHVGGIDRHGTHFDQ